MTNPFEPTGFSILTEPRMSVRQAAKALNISRPSMYRLVEQGKLKCIRIGHKLQFTQKQLEDFVRQSNEKTK